MTKIATAISSLFFFFNDTATTEIYTLSLHDALPISRAAVLCEPSLRRGLSALERPCAAARRKGRDGHFGGRRSQRPSARDRKSTRLNSSHMSISYAVFCLKKKKSLKITSSHCLLQPK